MFAAQAGALKVIVVDGSSKMASVATQIAKANGFFKDPTTSESSSKGVMMTVSGMWILEMYVAAFGKGGTSLAFWESVYGFNMKCVGDEVVCDAN